MPDTDPEVERELAALDAALAGRRVDARPDRARRAGRSRCATSARRPTPAFAAELDARVARGFRDRTRARRASGRRWWRALLSVPALGWRPRRRARRS